MSLGHALFKAILDHKDKVSQPHFIFSAENATHPHKNELKMDHNQTLHHLKNSGYDAHEVNGHYGAPERSIMVYGVDKEHADKLHNLASRLGQDSSIHSTGSSHEMKFHHGQQAGKIVRGSGTQWHKEKPNDFYTTLPSGHHFTHNFDFDKSDARMENYKEFKKSEDLKKDEKFSSKPPKTQVKINPEHGKTIANAYHSMKHAPNDPKVKASYGALTNETGKQFQSMVNSGLKVSPIKSGQQSPYKTSKDMHHDIKHNKHLWFFPTEQGFGEGAGHKDHPMLGQSGHNVGGTKLLHNDVFRIVHDVNGHHAGGESGFGPSGEHQAFLTHKKAYSPAAHGALFSETAGQNNWVNFGPHGEHNRKNPSQTKYAEQKAGLLPEHIVNGEWHK